MLYSCTYVATVGVKGLSGLTYWNNALGLSKGKINKYWAVESQNLDQ